LNSNFTPWEKEVKLDLNEGVAFNAIKPCSGKLEPLHYLICTLVKCRGMAARPPLPDDLLSALKFPFCCTGRRRANGSSREKMTRRRLKDGFTMTRNTHRRPSELPIQIPLRPEFYQKDPLKVQTFPS